MRTIAIAFAAVVFSCVASIAQIRIGVAGPLSGPFSEFGRNLAEGVEKAAKDINDSGGISGQKIIVSRGDDVRDPKQAVSVANKFIADGIKIVIGHDFSSSIIAASDVYKDSGTILFVINSSYGPITDRGHSNLFRVIGRDVGASKEAAAYISKHLRGKRLAVLYQDGVYGQALAKAALNDFAARNLRESFYAGVRFSPDALSNVASRMRSENIEVVYAVGGGWDVGHLAQQVRQELPSASLIATVSDENADLNGVTGEAMEGAIIIHPYDVRGSRYASEVLSRFRQASYKPSLSALRAYAAVQLINEAAKVARSVEPQRLSRELRSGKSFQTVIGGVSFDNNGDLREDDFVASILKKNSYGRVDLFCPNCVPGSCDGCKDKPSNDPCKNRC